MKKWTTGMDRARFSAPGRRDLKRFARWAADRYFSMTAPRPLWRVVRKRPKRED